MNDMSEGQVTNSAAEVYEKFFVPALFGEWGDRVAEAAAIGAGQRVLDVACGTGVLARAAARRVGPKGSVVGLDRNDGMLAVAARQAADIDWRLGRAEALPVADASFDAVVSQFGLMFFDDRRAALAEMWRVLRPGGRLGVAVWDGLDQAPGYAAMTQLLNDLFGTRVADELRAPYSLGDKGTLIGLFDAADIPDVDVATEEGTARFSSIEAWVRTDVKGWTLADMIDDVQCETLIAAARERLRPFEGADGTVLFRHPAHLVTAAKR